MTQKKGVHFNYVFDSFFDINSISNKDSNLEENWEVIIVGDQIVKNPIKMSFLQFQKIDFRPIMLQVLTKMSIVILKVLLIY